ncbi:MAG: FixH family protein [Chitinophagales bacterium]|nr:FixH family protein [Chitinophagales bacterium]OJV26074.1 MAG: hypothetical protein BGO32_06725 [Bacteroidetes bacterium 37-13]
MLKKFNWGWGIALTYTSFAVFILFMVYRSSLKTVELVTPDYYAKELKYQERIDQIANTKNLQTPLKWEVSGREVLLTFPKEASANASAKILFYKPNSSQKDVMVECKADADGKSIVASEKLESGMYQMQIEWQAGSISYYNESTINFQ